MNQVASVRMNGRAGELEGDPRSWPRLERARGLGRELDALHARTLESMGERDLADINRVRRASFWLEVLGRGALYLSVLAVAFLGLPLALGVPSFCVGVIALAVHKQLEWEIHHTVLHGAYDHLPGGETLRSRTARWDMPIDEAAWRRGHNVLHHGATNVLGLDPDLELCSMRFSSQGLWRKRHRYQMALLFGLVAPTFTFVLNAHLTGLTGLLFGEGEAGRANRGAPARERFRQALRKYLPYYAKNYVLFPAFAGVFFWKILLGNALSELLRDVYSALTFVCGHVGEEQKSWPVGTRSSSRGEWYAMQLEATNNFEVSLPVSLLCGGVDRHIEHHLFPRLPPNRLREIAPEVRAISEKYGFCYRTDSWGRTLAKAVRKLAWLGRGTPAASEAGSESA